MEMMNYICFIYSWHGLTFPTRMKDTYISGFGSVMLIADFLLHTTMSGTYVVQNDYLFNERIVESMRIEKNKYSIFQVALI